MLRRIASAPISTHLASSNNRLFYPAKKSNLSLTPVIVKQATRNYSSKDESNIAPDTVSSPENFLNYISDFSSDPSLYASGISIAGIMGVLASYYQRHAKSLQKMQAEYSRLHAEVNKLLPEIIACFDYAYTVTNNRIDPPADPIRLKTKLRILSNEINRIQSGFKALKAQFPLPWVSKHWNRESDELSYAKHRLNSYLHILETVTFCQFSDFNEASVCMANAIKEYIELYKYQHTNLTKLFLGSDYCTTPSHEKIRDSFLFAQDSQLCIGRTSICSKKVENCSKALKALICHSNKLLQPTESQTLSYLCYAQDRKATIIRFLSNHNELDFLSIAYLYHQQDQKSWLSDIYASVAYMQVDLLTKKLKLDVYDASKTNLHWLLPVINTLVAYALNENNFIITNNLSHTYALIGAFEPAEYYALESIKQNPLYALSRYNLGLIYFRKNKMEKANEQLELALAILSIYPDIKPNTLLHERIVTEIDFIKHSTHTNQLTTSTNLFPLQQLLSDEDIEMTHQLLEILRTDLR